MKNFYIHCFALFSFFVTHHQCLFAQSNTCAGATILTVGGAPVAGTCLGATNANTNSNCSAGGYLDPLDVWYKFTTGASGGAHVITLVCSGSFDGVIDFRNSTCFGSNILCEDNLGGGGTEVLTTGALTGATTYNVRIYPYSCCPATWTFTISVAPNCSNPSITTQPSNQTICAAGNASFSVVATGSSLTYQWQEFTGSWANITNGGIYSNATTATLNLTGVTSGMNGYQYRCVVSSSGGCPVNSNAATLTVNTAPSISVQPSNNTICVGGSSNMSVTASGTALTYNWQYFSGTWNNVSNGSPAGSAYSNQTTATMTVAGISAVGSYQYKCVVSGTCAPSATSSAATLTVNSDPSISTQPSSPTICSGTNTNLSVSVIDGMTLTYQWQYNNGTWNNVSNGSPAGSTYSNQTTATISINGISAAGAHQYRCIITDAGNGCTSPLTSGTGVVTVNAAPSITTQPSNQTVCTSSNANFTVATSAGSPTYQWQMSSDNSTWFSVSNGTPGGVTYTNGTTATLTANGTAAVALYYYRCVVTASGCSSNSNSATLTINSGPSISSQPANTTICAGSSGSFSITASGVGLTYQWNYYNGASWVAVSNGTPSGATYSGNTTASLSFSGITSAATYSYQCVVSGTCSPAATSSTALLTVIPTSSCLSGYATLGYTGANMDDRGYGIVEGNNGGYVIAGWSVGADPVGWSDGYLIKVNSNASSIQWQKGIGSASPSNDDIFYSIVKVSDGYVMAGRAMDFSGSASWDGYITKVNTNGVFQWSQRYGKDCPACGGSGYDELYSIAKSTSGFIATGYVNNENQSGLPDVMLLFVNTDGSFGWSKRYGIGSGGGAREDRANSVVQSTDGTYMIVGYTAVVSPYDMLVMNVSSTGVANWTKTIDGGGSNDIANSIIQSSDGNFMLAGYTNMTGNNDIYVAKMNGSGTILWDARYGGAGNDKANSVIQTADGGYIIAGSTTSYGEGGTDAYVVKISSDGTAQWSRTIGTGTTDVANSIIQLSDGSYALTGIRGIYAGSPDQDVLLAVLTNDGTINASCTNGSGVTTTKPIGLTTSAAALDHTDSNYGTSGNENTNNASGALKNSACGTLPIELLSLSATVCPEENCVNIFWQTTTEINNDYFTVERSADGTNWAAIGTVNGAGNSSSIHSYEFTDTELSSQYPILNTQIYYRLKQTDYDSRFEFFGPVAVSFSMSEEWNLIIKNPAEEELKGTLVITEDAKVVLDIIDLQGRVIQREILNALKGSHLVQFDIGNLDKGLYFIKAYNHQQKIFSRFIKI